MCALEPCQLNGVPLICSEALLRFLSTAQAPSLVLLELLEGSHHVCPGYRLRLSRVLHPSIDELFYKLLSGVHSTVNQERQDVADHQTFAKGDPEHLVFAQTKALPDPFDARLVPNQGSEGLLRLLGLFGFLAHTSILPSTSLRSPAHPLTTSFDLGMLTLSHLS